MYRPTSPQRPLFGVENRMNEDKRKRLEKTWAHAFRRSALPLVDESAFAKYFHQNNGRPNTSVRMVICILVLKELFDLTDVESLEQLEWNAAWQYAMDVQPEDAHTCQKTLHNFRARLLDDDQGASLFESTTSRLLQAASIRTGRQRMDSTHVVSNIKLLTRLGLFVQTITQFLEALRKLHPRLTAEVTKQLLERYLDREGYFSDARGSEARRRLEQSALDLYWLVVRFAEHRSVAKMESYALLKRLYEEQCVPPPSVTPERIELLERPSSSSLQSPSDPDATYGHKGKGYEAQLAETCNPDNPFEVVTAVSVNGANESDQSFVEPVLEQVERTCGAVPELMHADANFASGANLVAAKDKGCDLAAPIGSKAPTVHLPLWRFEFDAGGERVLRCPAGHGPERHVQTSTGMAAHFAMSKCRRCPLREQCPTEKRVDKRVLRFGRGDVAVARRRVEQETAAFKERHKLRSGIEATNSELKRAHGLGELRVRRKRRVELAVRLKVLALNFKRYIAHQVSAAAESRAQRALAV